MTLLHWEPFHKETCSLCNKQLSRLSFVSLLSMGVQEREIFLCIMKNNKYETNATNIESQRQGRL